MPHNSVENTNLLQNCLMHCPTKVDWPPTAWKQNKWQLQVFSKVWKVINFLSTKKASSQSGWLGDVQATCIIIFDVIYAGRKGQAVHLDDLELQEQNWTVSWGQSLSLSQVQHQIGQGLISRDNGQLILFRLSSGLSCIKLQLGLSVGALNFFIGNKN